MKNRCFIQYKAWLQEQLSAVKRLSTNEYYNLELRRISLADNIENDLCRLERILDDEWTSRNLSAAEQELRRRHYVYTGMLDEYQISVFDTY